MTMGVLGFKEDTMILAELLCSACPAGSVNAVQSGCLEDLDGILGDSDPSGRRIADDDRGFNWAKP